MAALAVLALHFWFPDFGGGVLHNTYSTTAEGQRAFYRLVQSQAAWTLRNSRPLTRALPEHAVGGTLCILGPERWPTHQEWDAILDWVADGGQLLFAFREEAEQQIPRINVRYIPREGSGPPDDSLPPQTTLVDSREIAWWTDGRLLAPQGRLLVAYDDTPQAVVVAHGAGRIVVSASSLVFSNQLLTYGDNPALAYRLLEACGDVEDVTFDESLNETGTPKTVGLLFDAELRPLTLQLILLCVLYAWWNNRRFGPLERSSVQARHNIVDHTDNVGLGYWRSRDGAGVLRAFLRTLLSELRTAMSGVAANAALEAAARRLNRPVASLRQDLQAAQRAAKKTDLDRRQAARFIRRLAAVRLAVLRRD